MSIKRKLTVTMMGISFAAVALTAASITAYLVYDMRANIMNNLAVTAAIAADRNSAAIAFLDNDRAQKNMEIYRESPAILSVCVYDAQNKLFTSYQRQNAAGPGCPAHPDEAKRSDGNILTAFKEIMQGPQKIGAVFIASDTSELEAYAKKNLVISGTAALVVLGISLTLTMYFQRAISGPILNLTDTAKTITERGDYTIAAREDYDDETGVLAHAFNAMVAEVHKRDRQLVHANESLEQKVEERTHQLLESKRRAEAASEAKSEFLRNMSHELRTPLHALINFSAYGIKEHDKVPTEQLKHYFEIIETGAQRLSRLVGEVLDLAKLEHGEHVFSLKRVDMRELATKAMDLVGSLTKEKGVSLKLECAPGQTVAVCDQDKILQVMTNLLANAIKFTPAGKSIHLQAHMLRGDMGPQVEVSVIDEGVGIPDAEKDIIFDSFRQSTRTNTGAGGTGLGLAICRHIIGAHQGRIWAENNANGPGARVTFVMPATLTEGNRIIHGHTDTLAERMGANAGPN